MAPGRHSKLSSLVQLALHLGAVEAKIIPANKIVVENRVILKCRVGCDTYGKRLMCPPYAPTVDEFRKMLREYRYALLAKFSAEAETDEDIARNLLKYRYDPNSPVELKEKAAKFWSNWGKDKRRIHLALLELEKAAFENGYVFAVGFSTGSCALCEKCNVEVGVCIHPTMARYPDHAVGINVQKTTKKAGMPIAFPFTGKPEAISLLLID